MHKFKKLKKPVSILLTVALLLSVVSSLTVSANVFDNDRFDEYSDTYHNNGTWHYYTNSYGEALIEQYFPIPVTSTGFDENGYPYLPSTSLTFPARIDNYDVKMIYGICEDPPGYMTNVFSDHDYWDGTYTGNIPNTINHYSSENLETLIIEDGIEKIGAYAFNNCPSLNSVTIPASVNYIGPRAFSLIDKHAEIYMYSTDAVFCDETYLYYEDDDPYDDEPPEVYDYAIGGVFGPCTDSAFLGWSTYDITIYGVLGPNGQSTAKDYAESHDGVTFIPINPLDTPYDPAISATGAASDGNRFGLSGFNYTYGTLLGAQEKTGTGNCLRFVGEISTDLLADNTLTDYGFEICKASTTTTPAFSAAGGFTAMNTALSALNGSDHSSSIVKASCKNTVNNIVPGYGNNPGEGDTDYKYVTLAINNVSASQGVAVRFYAVINGNRWYANYTPANSDSPYRGMCTNYTLTAS
ncbi:MAG: leucine-rich repeat domain-containing protein [Ruminococcus sp.]|nr:leucine-rich repeat domain-containing protein [Ruminococcus sp.]